VRTFSALVCFFTCSFYPSFVKFLLPRQWNICQMGCISVSETGSRLVPAEKPTWTRLSTFGFNKRRGISWPSLGNYLLLAKGSVLWD